MSLYTRLEQRLERNSDDAGPVAARLSLLRIGMIWLAANLVVTTLLTGTLFVPGVDYGLAILLIIVGTLVGAARARARSATSARAPACRRWRSPAGRSAPAAACCRSRRT